MQRIARLPGVVHAHSRMLGRRGEGDVDREGGPPPADPQLDTLARAHAHRAASGSSAIEASGARSMLGDDVAGPQHTGGGPVGFHLLDHGGRRRRGTRRWWWSAPRLRRRRRCRDGTGIRPDHVEPPRGGPGPRPPGPGPRPRPVPRAGRPSSISRWPRRRAGPEPGPSPWTRTSPAIDGIDGEAASMPPMPEAPRRGWMVGPDRADGRARPQHGGRPVHRGMGRAGQGHGQHQVPPAHARGSGGESGGPELAVHPQDGDVGAGVAVHHNGALAVPEGGDGVDRAGPGHGVERGGHQPAGSDRHPAFLHDAVVRGDLQRDHRLQRGAAAGGTSRQQPMASVSAGEAAGPDPPPGEPGTEPAVASSRMPAAMATTAAPATSPVAMVRRRPGGAVPLPASTPPAGTRGDDEPRTSDGWRQSRSSGGSHPRSGVASCVASPKASAPGRGRSPPFPSSRRGSSGPSSEDLGQRGVTARQVTDGAGGSGVAEWPYDWADVP